MTSAYFEIPCKVSKLEKKPMAITSHVHFKGLRVLGKKIDKTSLIANSFDNINFQIIASGVILFEVLFKKKGGLGLKILEINSILINSW